LERQEKPPFFFHGNFFPADLFLVRKKYTQKNKGMGSIFEDAKAFLMTADGNGNNLYDHFTDLLLNVLEKRPQDAFRHFENISTEIKTSHVQYNDDNGIQVRLKLNTT
jgi:hypothetical protein